MKKSIIFFAAIAAFFSCSKENPVNEIPAEETFSVELFASAPAGDAETKTTLVDGEGTKFVHWSKGDAIKVLFFPKRTSSNTITGPSGVFTSHFEDESSAEAYFRTDSWSWAGISHDIYNDQRPNRLAETGVAVYPSTATAFSNKTSTSTSAVLTSEISFVLPEVQNAVAGNIESGLNFSYADVNRDSFINTVDNGAKTELYFMNACALIQLTMPAEMPKVTSISITSNDGVALTGHGSLNLNGYKDTVEEGVTVADGSGVTLNCPAGFIAGETYYAVVWPGEHNSGLTIEFTAEDGTVATKTTLAVTLTASKVKPYTFSKGLEFVAPVKEFNYIYADGTTGNDVKSNIVGVVIYRGNPKEQFNDIELPDTYSNGLALGLTSYDIKWNDTKILSGVNEALREATSTNIKNYSLGGYTARTYWMQTHPNILLYNYNYGSLPGNVSPWYHGTPKEWQYIVSHIDSINEKLTAVSGAQTIVASQAYWLPIHNGTYSSSSNAAYAVSYNGSSVTYPVKAWYNYTGQALARPIFAF